MMRSTSSGVNKITGSEVRRIVSILLLPLVFSVVFSCGKEPDPAPVPDVPVPPEPEPEPASPKDVTLMAAFKEDFSGRESSFMDFARRAEGEDFRYYSAFPSLSENGSSILMLRLDTADPEGKGATVTSKDYVYFGSYSARIRIPDVSRVQAKLGVVAQLSLLDTDPVWGTDEYGLGWRLADAKNLYLKGRHEAAGGDSESILQEWVEAPSLKSFSASSKFYIYGLDWTASELSWWVKTSENAQKDVLARITENVPFQPLRLQFKMYHSKTSPAKGNSATTQAPLYPFELEIDWIQYTPFEQ